MKVNPLVPVDHLLLSVDELCPRIASLREERMLGTLDLDNVYES